MTCLSLQKSIPDVWKHSCLCPQVFYSEANQGENLPKSYICHIWRARKHSLEKRRLSKKKILFASRRLSLWQAVEKWISLTALSCHVSLVHKEWFELSPISWPWNLWGKWLWKCLRWLCWQQSATTFQTSVTPDHLSPHSLPVYILLFPPASSN